MKPSREDLKKFDTPDNIMYWLFKHYHSGAIEAAFNNARYFDEAMLDKGGCQAHVDHRENLKCQCHDWCDPRCACRRRP